MNRIVFLVIVTLVLSVALPGRAEEDRFYGGDILFTRPVKSVLFSHQSHAVELGFECETCHNGIFKMKKGSAEGSGDFTMKALYEGRYCGACHNGEMAFASDTQCARCHAGVKGADRFPEELRDAGAYLKPEGMIKMGDGATSAVFSHESHAGMFECMECHPDRFSMKRNTTGVSMDGIYQGRYCGACHNGEMAFGADSCANCHPEMGGGR